MSQTFSFVHAADLHIGSPFVGLTAESPDIAERLRASTYEAFEALINLCIERRVDFLLIGGDVYDGSDRSLKAQLVFRNGLARLDEEGISTFVVHGNHDPLDGRISSLTWPERAHIFGDDVATKVFEIDGEAVATVSGVSYANARVRSNLARKFSAPGSALFHIALLHCNVGSNTGHDAYAPCELGDLVGSGFDYWALGHVHTREVVSEDPLVVYPGNPQGRSFREVGERGCYHVTVGVERKPEIEFVALDRARWREERVSIEGLATIDELEACITQQLRAVAVEAGDRLCLLRLVFDGRGALHRELRSDGAILELLEHLRESFDGNEPPLWIQRIRNESRSEVDFEKRRQAGDLLAEVLNLGREIREGDITEILGPALKELFATTRVSKVIEEPTSEDLLALVESAELLCLDLLED